MKSYVGYSSDAIIHLKLLMLCNQEEFLKVYTDCPFNINQNSTFEEMKNNKIQWRSN